MISDITTVMTKEWREFFVSGGSRRTGLVFLLIVLAIFGLYLPYRAGPVLISSPWIVVLYAFVLPVLLMSNIIADAIAGERERHTLETLLASRLSDRAIILGKLGAAVGYSVALAVVTALVGMVAANLQGGGSFQVYSFGVFASIVAFALLLSFLYASFGVLVSLRANTVRQAQLTMGVSMLVIYLLPILIYGTLSDTTRQQFLDWVSTANWATVVYIAVVLILIDLIAIAAVILRFQRSRLILS
ncbi:MAG TPA: ABC transporter permease subunit [Ktedonobacterales bacterium]|nr:ABC transporter permease subunit [Ktedonobacterales bacterium]